MEFVPASLASSAVPQPVMALTSAEREQLNDWMAVARKNGIEAVEDLGTRPWPLATCGAVILGVFRTGEGYASWLLVGQHGTWAVAACDHQSVLGSFETLSDALAAVCPPAQT